MKLYIKQKVFSWGDKFFIKDSDGNDRYYVEGELFSWGHKLHVYDISNNQEVAFIKQKVLTWLPRFEVYLNNMLAVEVRKEFSFFSPKYSLLGTSWTVDGHFLSHDYTISNRNSLIATVAKAWFSWGDSYELNINNNADELLVVATVLAIDCVLEAESRSSSNGINI